MSTQASRTVDQLEQLHVALNRPRTATVEETAAALVHAARGASDPHAEAGRIVSGLFPEGNDYSRALLAAIQADRSEVERVEAEAFEAAAAAELGYERYLERGY